MSKSDACTSLEILRSKELAGQIKVYSEYQVIMQPKIYLEAIQKQVEEKLRQQYKRHWNLVTKCNHGKQSITDLRSKPLKEYFL